MFRRSQISITQFAPANRKSRRSNKLFHPRLRLHALEDRTVPNTYTVNVLTDANAGTGLTGDLRYCITQANLDGQADTINFSVTGTINLSLGQLPITTTQALKISGPGAANLSIAGAVAPSSTNRIFNVSDNANVTIAGVKLTSGNLSSGSGAAIAMGAATVTLSFANVSGNKSAGNGGAVNLSGTSGTLNVNDSTMNNNSGGRGGGIHVDNSGALNVSLSNSTMSGNTATGAGPGGAVYFEYDGTLTVTNSTITGNSAGSGAGIQLYTASATITNSTISNNSASGSGGGIFLVVAGSSLTMDNSTVSGNSAGSNGGGIDSGSGTVIVSNSSFFGNIGNQGGAFGLFGTPGQLQVSNSSIFNNTANDGGAFRLNGCNTGLVLDNDTIVGNSASVNAGGINRFGGSGDITVVSTIIAKNLASGAAGHPDVENNNTAFNYMNSLIGNLAGITSPNDLGGNITGVDPQLYSAANNGGPTLTMLPHLGSPVLDTGANPLGLTTDQRGFSRSLGAGVDIGAVELDQTIPQASGTFADVTTAGGTTYTLQVTYADLVGINTGSLDNSDIRVTGPNSFNVLATFVPPATGAPTPVTATYQFTPPGGSWNGPVNGTYTVSLQANQVSNTNAVFVPAGAIGTFNVSVPQGPQTFTVTNANDNGPGSLRQAILNANAVFPSSDTINFDSTFFSTPRTITMALGQMAITDSVLINGPGASQLTINANHASRVFNVSSGTLAPSVNISGVTMTGGLASTGAGIDVSSNGASLTLTGATVTGNIATSGGGGIRLVPGTSLMVQGSTISNNVATGPGGGIFVDHPSATARCSLNIVNSTVSGNSATADGGGVYWNGVVGSGGFSFVQSTFANNRNNSNGAAIRLFNMDGTLLIRNCTIAYNTNTGGNGGGIDYYHPATFTPIVGDLVTIESTVFNHNFAPVGGNDIRNDNNTSIPPVVLETTIFQDTVGFNYTADATDLIGVDALLRPLADNGGPTATCLPQLNSPALNVGSNPATLTTDQRGQPRQVGAAVDMGSVELDPNIPIATGTFATVTTKGGTLYTLTVTYLDDTAIKLSTIDSSDIRITGPNGFNVPATFVPPANPNANSPSIMATYTFVPPGGSWDAADNGLYSVRVQANQVSDTGVTPAFVMPVVVGTINVAVALDLVVNATNDESVDTDGKTSLREAVLLANAFSAGGNIKFDPTVFATAKTITLTLGQITIAATMSITGPAAGVTVSGGNSSRIFSIDVPFSSGNAINLSNMSITNGVSTGSNGGAITDAGESLTLTNVVVSNCSSTTSGGAIYVSNSGPLTLINSKLMNNSTPGRGGGVFVQSASDVRLQNSTISGNTAGSTGGGFYFYNQGSFVATGSTIANNASNGGNGGGGVYFFGTANPAGVVFTNCTITGNSANSGGGGIRLYFFSGTATIQNCTITNNASSVGGGLQADNDVTIVSSIVSGNFAASLPEFFVSGTVTANTSLIGDSSGATTFNGDAFTNANIGVNPMLDPAGLASNGGLTQTIALLPGSPAINNGSNPSAAAFDQRGNTRVVGPAADVGAYEVQAPAKFSSVVINGGAAQRSMVTQVTVNFNQHVGYSGAPAAAFTLKRVSDNAVVNLAASADDTGSGTAVTLTFTGGAVNGASLADGRYALHILASGFNAEGFDGNGNGVAQGSPADDFAFDQPASPAALDLTKIFRLFGDADGNGIVDGVDFGAFRLAFNTNSSIFDFDGSGIVDGLDFGQFRAHFGAVI